jgi:GxxExxY protein
VKEVNDITEAVIGCAIEVHRQLGPGLLEASYESALCIELDDAGLSYQRQTVIPAVYKGRTIGDYRRDLVLEDAVVVGIKSVERFDSVVRGTGSDLSSRDWEKDRFADQLQ